MGANGNESAHDQDVAGEDAARETSVPRAVWRSTALLFLGRQWGLLCTLTSLGILSRVLPGAEFGRLTFYLAAFTLLDSLADFGTGAVAVQRSAHDEGLLPAVLSPARRIRLAAACTGSAALALFAWLSREEGAGWIAVAALFPATRALEVSGVVFQRRIEWRAPVAARAVAASLRLGLVALLAAEGVRTAGPFLIAHAAGLAVGNVLVWRLARRLVPPAGALRVPVRELLRAAAPLAAAGICQQLYFYVDNVFVRHLRGDVELGRYNAAVRVLSVLIAVSAYATSSALPWLARHRRTGTLGTATARLSQSLCAVTGLGLGVLWPWTGELLGLLYGPDFAEAESSLRWLLGAAFVIAFGAAFLTAVVASGRTGAVLGVTLTALLCNVLGNAWLVPRHGAEGAAMATLATEIVVTAGALAVLRGSGELHLSRPWAWLAGPVLFAIGAGASSLF